ncbi:hypothetical protein SARC_17352, partial [Sphaeroforma arctica JP610]
PQSPRPSDPFQQSGSPSPHPQVPNTAKPNSQGPSPRADSLQTAEYRQSDTAHNF